MKPVNVLVVDDSAFMRRAIIRMLGSDPQLTVIGQAVDGEEALKLMGELQVDVVTLDLEMPGMGGLATLARLRADHRVPVVVLSGAAAQGAAVTLQALDLGAFDVVAKPTGGPLAIHAVTQELVAKVRGAAGVKDKTAKPTPSGPLAARPRTPAPPPTNQSAWDLILLGTSTGGPPALQQVIPALPEGFPVPVVVLQHMPPGYTKALAERLDKLSAVAVREAEEGDRLLPGQVLVAPSGRQLTFRQGPQGPTVHLVDEIPFQSYYSPSIDFTFQEAARMFHARVLGVVMTGMGSDGTQGLTAIKEAGGRCWGQDEATSVIYGMPRAAAEAGVVDMVFPLQELAGRLSEAVSHPAGHPTAR